MITVVVNLVGDRGRETGRKGDERCTGGRRREGGKQEKVREKVREKVGEGGRRWEKVGEGGRRWEKVGEGGRRWWEAGEKGKIMQQCAISLNTKNAKRRKPTNTGRKPGLKGTGSGRFKPPAPPTNTC